jgi:hypothetical protein
VAGSAALSHVKNLIVTDGQSFAHPGINGLLSYAVGTIPPYQSLRENTIKGPTDQVVFDTHINHAHYGAGSTIGVQCTQHKMASKRALNRYLAGFTVSYFADHNDIGIMSKHIGVLGIIRPKKT